MNKFTFILKIKEKMIYIAVDFDGTCVTHEYPEIGKFIGAEKWLKLFVEMGAKLILNTMRDKKELDDAILWFNKCNIELYGVNNNPDQNSWTTSPKVYANIYIDDAAFGCPLIIPEAFLNVRPYVDWEKVGPDIYSKLKKILDVDVIINRRLF